MEIERINDNTLKFFISYGDIEDRGFDREEIWYNRERSEELFWEMMDEIHQEEDFQIEGPLWIQVQALEKGLEVVVTKAQIAKDGLSYELPLYEEKWKDLPYNEQVEAILDEAFLDEKDAAGAKEQILNFTIKFADFEDLVRVSHIPSLMGIRSNLYSFEGRYYLYATFFEEEHTEEEIDNLLAVLLEYGQESAMTVHRLAEYGKLIIADDAIYTICKNFPI